MELNSLMYDIVYVKLTDNLDGYHELKKKYPHVILLDSYTNLIDAVQQAKQLCFTNMYWLVADCWDIDSTDILAWRPWNCDKLVPYFWKKDLSVEFDKTHIEAGDEIAFANGSYLLPLDYEYSENDIKNNKLSDIALITGSNPGSLPFDIFFVSYNETNADEHWQQIYRRFPQAKRVHGIKGIDKAHRRCAELSRSGMFWTIDADSVIHDDFNFNYIPEIKERNYLYIWHSLNPVNGLEYGWGAVKLWPTKLVLDFDGNWLDFTTTVGNIRMMPEVVATSAFNVDEWTSWRSGFREAIKLCVNVSNGDYEKSLYRLITWLTVSKSVPYANDARNGALEGVEFFLSATSLSDLLVINDFDKLKPIFENRNPHLVFDMPVDKFVEKLKAHSLV